MIAANGHKALGPALAALALLACTSPPAGAAAPQTSFADVLKLPRGKPDAHLAYGSGPSQFVELWLPAGPGPHPVVIMLHGGCWQVQVADLHLMDPLAEDLRRRGVAVWNVEYRRLGEPGGGYPGTFDDVAHAVDLMGASAPKYGLKLDQVVALGHSAGGHLALWAAARSRLAKDSPLYAPHPLKVDSVVALGGLGDLEAVAASSSDRCGGAPTVQALIGPATAAHPDPYSDTSPVRLEPFPARQILVHGAADAIAPTAYGSSYRDKAVRAGGKAEISVIPDAGHFDLIAPSTPAWAQIRTTIGGLLRLGRFGGQTPPPPKAKASPW
jgi:acetyl esterase/lipase